MRRLGNLCVWLALVVGLLFAVGPRLSDPSSAALASARESDRDEHRRRCEICRSSGPRLPDEIDGANVRLVGHRAASP